MGIGTQSQFQLQPLEPDLFRLLNRHTTFGDFRARPQYGYVTGTMRNKFFSNAVNLCYLAALFVLPMWLAGMLGFDVVSDITVAVAFIWAFLAYIFGGVPSHWSNPMRDGWPTAYYRSRRRPPWQFPREVNSSGSRTDRADYRLLEQRLVKIADLPSAPVGWSDVALFHDPISGQYWRRELHEAGFNQWHILIPVDRPDAGALGTAIGAPKSE